MNQHILISALTFAGLVGVAGTARAQTPSAARPMAVFHDGMWVRAPGTCGTPQTPPVNEFGARLDNGPVNANGMIQQIWINRAGGSYNIGNGPTSSATNKVNKATWGSQFPTNPAAIMPAFTGAGFDWPIVSKCVKDHFQKYNITITDGTSPPSGDYIEAVIGGDQGAEIGYPVSSQNGGLFGIAATDSFCSLYSKGIAFVFEGAHHDAFSATYRNAELCNTIVHETGHVLGLEHEELANDNMSYVYIEDTATGAVCHSATTNVGTMCKYYVNQSARCGTDPQHTMASCSCGGTTTNSGLRMESLVGLRPVETVPPTLTVTGPASGDLTSLPPTFDVVAMATDNMAMDSVSVSIDDTEIGRNSTPDNDVYTIRATAIAEGPHELKVQAFDQAGNVTVKTLAITVKLAATGESCVDGTACHGGICAMQASGNQFCTETCVVGGTACPSDFTCKAVGETSVCIPKPGTPVGMDKGNDDGGCSTGGNGGPLGAGALLALGLGLVLSRRRK